MTREPENGKIVLEARNVTKKFPGVVALDDVSFQVHRGKVNALIGENGAGKSTLMKIFSGVYTDYEGDIFLDGKPIRFSNTKDAHKSSIGIIYQELNLVPNLSIAENIFLGREPLKALGMLDYRHMYQETEKILKTLNLDLDPRTRVSFLRVGQQQIIEIGRALSMQSRILIMDEPTSAISDEEVDLLFKLIRQLTKQDVTVIYISHKMDELFRISDRITVLRDGKVVKSFDTENVTADQVIQNMVGRPLKDLYPRTHTVSQEKMMTVSHCSLRHPTIRNKFSVKDVSFHVNKGEVLGIFGLMGAGRTEMLETLFGLHPTASQVDMWIDDAAVKVRHPKEAIYSGLGFVPEDRKTRGLVRIMSVMDNINLASLKKSERAMFLQNRLQDKQAKEYVKKLNIKTPSLRQMVDNLSGGNQQKVILGKWLATNPKILLLDEPTRGIDVNAKREIYALIDDLVKEGLSIIMASSELPEIMGISDRILVMAEGCKTAEFSANEATEELVMKAAIP